MINSTKAVGIKLYQGGSSHGIATVRNVTYDGVTVQNSDYAAQIQSCYGSDTTADCNSAPSQSIVDGVYFKNFVGTTSSKFDPVSCEYSSLPSVIIRAVKGHCQYELPRSWHMQHIFLGIQCQEPYWEN